MTDFEYRSDAVQSLARIAQSATRLMALVHRVGAVVDPDEEIDHMRANLDYVVRELSR